MARAATRLFTRKRHFFKTRFIKPSEELLSLFQKKQENEFIWVKLVNILNSCNEKVTFIVFHVKNANKSVPKKTPVFVNFYLLKKSLTKSKKLKISSKKHPVKWRVF